MGVMGRYPGYIPVTSAVAAPSVSLLRTGWQYRYRQPMENPYSADTPTGPNRPQHERIHVILRMIHDRSLPNATDFMEELEVTRRTIMRDLDYLRDRMKMPIDYDKKERGYYFSGKVEGVPLLEMRASDLLWFFVGQHFLRQAGDDELANLIRESFQRISGLFGSKVSVSWGQLEGLLSAKTSGIGEAELRTFRAVSDALARSRVIRFGYRKNDSSEIEQRQACPRHCAMVNGQWYLFAHDLGRDAIRTFVLSRMDGIEVTEETFVPGDAKDVPELLRKGFGVKFASGEPTKVRIRVSPEISHLIRERKWHPSQSLTTGKDGFLMLEMKVNAFRELTNWICSWGPLMEVLEPKSLRKEVAETFRKAAEVYAG